MAADWLVGGGELGALIRAKDWAATPLGPIDDWPQSLRSAVSILLPSKAQIVAVLGARARRASTTTPIGRCSARSTRRRSASRRAKRWSEIWDVLEPLFGGVVNDRRGVLGEGPSCSSLERHGYAEETYFDVSYDPVRDETGRVGGVFCIVSETTGRVVGERRLAALRDLGRVGNGATSAGDVFRNTAAVLENYGKDMPFAALYSWDADAQRRAARSRRGHRRRRSTARRCASMRPVVTSPGRSAATRRSCWPSRRADVQLPGGPWPEPVKQAAILQARHAAPTKPMAISSAG